MTPDWVHFALTILMALASAGICLLRIGRVAGHSEGKIGNIERHVAKLESEAEELRRHATGVYDALSQHKLHVATCYVSNERFDTSEGKLSAWMNRVEQKLDRLIERRSVVATGNMGDK